jgi:hypothetical protein
VVAASSTAFGVVDCGIANGIVAHGDVVGNVNRGFVFKHAIVGIVERVVISGIYVGGGSSAGIIVILINGGGLAESAPAKASAPAALAVEGGGVLDMTN